MMTQWIELAMKHTSDIPTGRIDHYTYAIHDTNTLMTWIWGQIDLNTDISDEATADMIKWANTFRPSRYLQDPSDIDEECIFDDCSKCPMCYSVRGNFCLYNGEDEYEILKIQALLAQMDKKWKNSNKYKLLVSKHMI